MGEQTATRRGFMCKIDYEIELEAQCEPPAGTRIFATEEECRALRNCSSHCGMVEVEVRLVKEISHAE